MVKLGEVVRSVDIVITCTGNCQVLYSDLQNLSCFCHYRDCDCV